MTISILGGTGPQGQGIALRLARAGFEVAIGSRDQANSSAVAKELNTKLEGKSPEIVGLENIDAVKKAGIEALAIADVFHTNKISVEEVRKAAISYNLNVRKFNE